MRIKINREQPFQVLATNFSIGPSSSGYDLQISADGVNFTTLFSVGANVTRMVTGVANGSTYRLEGNTDEDVIVNWTRQCDDGQGGGGQGQQGPEGPQGATGPQGPQGPAGSGSTGDFNKLMAVSEFPESAETGDVVAYSVSTSGLPSGILFESGNTYDETEDQYGATFSFPMGAFTLRPETNPVYVGKAIVEAGGETTELCMYVYADPFNPNGATFCVSNTCDINNKTMYFEISTYADSHKEMISDIYFDHQFTDQEEGYMTVDVYTSYELEGYATLSFELAEGGSENGLYQFDGTSWNAVGGGGGEQNLIHLDAIDDTTTGQTGKVYECNGRLYKWVEGAGYWGKWIGGWSNSYPAGNVADGAYNVQFNYAYLPSEQVQIGISYRLNNITGYLYWDPENSSFVSYSDSEMQTEISRVYLGDENTVIGPYSIDSGKVWLTWKDGVLIFKCGGNASIRSRVNTYTANDHFEAINSDNYAHAFECITSDGITEGIPIWNSEGIIVAKRATYSTKSVYINSTGSSSTIRTDYITTGINGGANRMFVPTAPGTAGQVLTSAGNAEPTWATLIKSVKITSDAYEALVQAGTTDPNVLYLIDDE